MRLLALLGQQLALLRTGFGGEGVQGVLPQRLQALHRHLHAARHALAQGGAHRLRQRLVQGMRVGVRGLLLCAQLRTQALLLLGHLQHQRLHVLRQLGQHLGVLRQGLPGLLALRRLGVRMQGAAQGRIQGLRHLGALATAQGQHQPQHGRGGHPGHRAAKGQAQAADGLGKGLADAGHAAHALQGKGGALQGQQHAHKGAQHAQHHQQAHQVGAQGRTRQGAAHAIQARQQGRAQGLGHARQPRGQLGLRLVAVRQCLTQGQAVLPKAPELARPRAIDQAHHQGGQQHQRVAAQGQGGHRQHGGCAQGQRKQKEFAVHERSCCS